MKFSLVALFLAAAVLANPVAEDTTAVERDTPEAIERDMVDLGDRSVELEDRDNHKRQCYHASGCSGWNAQSCGKYCYKYGAGYYLSPCKGGYYRCCCTKQ